MNSLYKYILSLLLVGLVSCEDTLHYDAVGIPEGESTVTATIDFHQFDKTNLGSRAAGDAYDFIRNLWILVYNSDGSELIKSHEVSIAKPVSEKTEARIDLDFGRYQIYAVANIDSFDPTKVPAVDDLKSLRLDWKQPDTDGNIGKNDEMLGVFVKENTESDGSNTIVVNRKTVNISAQLVRAASKVTVSYDGSALEEGVNVYIRSLSIKRIPTGCYLGNQSMVTKTDSLIGDGGTIVYYDGTAYDSSTPTLLNKNNPTYPRKDTVDEDGNPAWSDDPHAHTSPRSLFFFENLQGIKDIKQEPRFDKRQKDDNNDGQLDYLFPYTELPCATYIEVDARWESTNPKFPGITDLKYRFMLGQNVIDDYNVWRNCHYKLTLHLSGYAADPDWRIAYERMLSVTPVYEVDYRGMYFKPDPTKANLGNEFAKQDIITVNSYKFPEGSPGETRYAVDYDVQFQDENGNPLPNNQKPDWLIFEEKEQTETGITNYKFGFINNPNEVTINDVLAQKGYTVEQDLSLVDGKRTTANCYIVDGYGTFTFPLVYGNAIEGGAENDNSYKNFTGDDSVLENLVNYLNKPITTSYIIDDILSYKKDNDVKDFLKNFDPSQLTPWVVWTDVPTLVSLEYGEEDIQYDPTLYNNHGGIRIRIKKGNIKEGNIVIGIKDNAGNIMWSWHIWVTAIDYKNYIPTLTSVTGKKYDIMPVNLGWCSNNVPVRYFSRKACKVKFTQKEKDADQTVAYSQTIDIVQHPFIAIPQGNSTYYQWGRKDPFFGTNASYVNKEWYEQRVAGMAWDGNPYYSIYWGNAIHHLKPEGNWHQPYNYFNEDDEGNPRGDPNSREKTINLLAELIKNPLMFNNPPREGYQQGVKDRNRPSDEIFSNLWLDNIKTVYDPCPAGFQVSPYDTFLGFTFNGDDIEGMKTNGINNEGKETDYPSNSLPTYKYAWNNVSLDNLYIVENEDEKYTYNSGVFGFYTDETKLEPLCFPNNGYLDYAAVEVYWVKNHGYIWLAKNIDDIDSPFLKYCINLKDDPASFSVKNDEDLIDGLVGPKTGFYATNAMCVRPTRIHQ